MGDDIATEALLTFLDSVEAGVAAAKHMIGQQKGVSSTGPLPDFDKLFWETKEGGKGPYQQTSKSATGNSDLFRALQTQLKKNKGYWKHRGFDYWLHQGDKDVIDRRRK